MQTIGSQNVNIDSPDIRGKYIQKQTNISNEIYQIQMSWVTKYIYFIKMYTYNKSLLKNYY